MLRRVRPMYRTVAGSHKLALPTLNHGHPDATALRASF
jgi:hypothetical protein